MGCPTCGGSKVGVILTRQLLEIDGGGTLRRHVCRDCKHRWYSHQGPPVVVASWRIYWLDSLPRLRRP